MAETEDKTPKPETKGSGLRMALDFGPLLVFFAVNSLAPGDDVNQAVWATTAFMIATGIAMIVSKLKTGRIAPMQWFTGIVVAVFGGMTIYLRDESFFQIKTTIIYAMFAAILFFGLITGRPLLKLVMESGFPEMDDDGWKKLTRNWAIFFLAMAMLNEALRAWLTFDQWVAFKVWGVLVISMIFAASQAPILMKHGKDGGGQD
ncbi:septation protein IspZ [Sphingosinicella soli]|uniref:Inner membrane-spanning protein YciB n=1 Tax=Sphingosinicella soli TaxID=333708 RepID=A0A7W7B311_9SPHN|nr:septation protein IspZ [Sphingosinicella soli]MBB4632163.1 intracellular septation protein [Sphingosinicella soli]